MATFDFITKSSSAVLQIDGGNQFPINGFYVPVPLIPDNKTLQINPSTRLRDWMSIPNINVDNDTITIDSVLFTGTTAQELYDSLETLFFLDDGSGSGGVAEDLTTSELDTSKILQPDGVGGVNWAVNAAGVYADPEGTVMQVGATGELEASSMIEMDEVVYSSKTLQVDPASLNVGPALTVSERGGYAQITSNVSGDDYLAVSYLVDDTGTGKPFIGERGTKIIKNIIQPVNTTPMVGVTELVIGISDNADIHGIYLNFINPVTNLRATTVSDATGNVIDYFPSLSNILKGTGDSFSAGEQLIQFQTPLSVVAGIQVTISIEADQSIDLLGDGVTVWLAEDVQNITITGIVTEPSLLYTIRTTDTLIPNDELLTYVDAVANPVTLTLATNPAVGVKKSFFIEDNTNPITIKSESPSFPIAPPVPIAEANVQGQWAFSGDFDAYVGVNDLTNVGIGGNFVPVTVNSEVVQGFDFEGTATLDATVTSYKGVTGGSPRSFACWYQANAGTPTGLETIAMWGDETSGGRSYQIAFRSDLGASGTLAISNFGASRQFPYASLTNLFDGNAHHIAVTQAGASTANIALYIDGVRITPSTTDSNPACNTASTNDFRIGNSIANNRPLNATLYDCRLWDIGISAAQVLDVMGQNLDGSRIIANAPQHTLFEMMFNGVEWHFGDGITNFILNNDARISAIEATYVTTNNHEREYFVSVSAGDDLNTGLNALDQLATLNQALTLANALSPAPSSTDRVSITDLSTSEYVLASDIILPTGLILSLPHSGIKGDDGVTVELNTDSNLIIGRLITGETNGSTAARLAGTNASLTATNIIVGDVGVSQVGIRMLGQGVNINVNSIESRSDSCTLLLMDGSSNNSQPIYFDRMVLSSTNSTALAVNTADPVSISVGSITDGGNAGCLGLFVASNGNVSLDAISMDSDTLLSGGTFCEINLGSISDTSTITVEVGATLNIWCTRGNPTVVNNGTINGYIGGTYYGDAKPVAEELVTTEVNTALFLKPDGLGGVNWNVTALTDDEIDLGIFSSQEYNGSTVESALVEIASRVIAIEDNPRLSTLMSVNLVLTGSEQQIAFDPAQTSRNEGFTVNVGGSFTVDFDGFYKGSLALFVDKSGGAGANLSIWVEIKPLLTGVWELSSTGMSNPIVYDDGGQPVALTICVDALAGDEIRVMIKKNSGTATLTTISNVMSLGTVFDYASELTIIKVGDVTP